MHVASPLQRVSPVGHTHWPPWQVSPPVHARPHVPQLALSVDVLVQAASQKVCSAGHVQVPAWQVSPPLHAWPQVPQFALSVDSLVQMLPQ
jgi:hypothetical protein